MIEAVMPISDREPVRRHLDRAIMALESYDHFWRGASPLILHIVVPDHELDPIRIRLSPVADRLRNVEVRLRPESQISPVFKDIEGRGYSKQMLIKLAAFLFVEAPFYITFDTDVVACKPIWPEDLVCNNKGVNDWVVPTTTIWYIRSLDILGLHLSLAKLRFFVTPQVLSTKVSRGLADFLTYRFSGRNWMYGLMQANSDQGIWSEYSLYDLFAEYSGLLDQYHLPPGENRLQFIDGGIWYPADFAAWRPEKLITGEQPGLFTVLQSITANDVCFDDVWQRWLETVIRYYPDYPQPPASMQDGRAPGAMLSGAWQSVTDPQFLALLGSGWSKPESWGGIWGIGPAHELRVQYLAAPDEATELQAEVEAAMPGERQRQEVDVVVMGQTLATWIFTRDENRGLRMARIPATLVAAGMPVLTVAFRPHSVASPAELEPGNKDDRPIGMAIHRIRQIVS